MSSNKSYCSSSIKHLYRELSTLNYERVQTGQNTQESPNVLLMSEPHRDILVICQYSNENQGVWILDF